MNNHTDYDYGDDIDYVTISAAAEATTRELTDEEREQLEQLEKRRLPFGFQAGGGNPT